MLMKQGKAHKIKQYNPAEKQRFFQPRLTVGPVDDVYEKEADAVADQIMRMPADKNQSTFFTPKPLSVTSLVQSKCAACEEDERRAQRKPTSEVVQRDEEEEVPSPDFSLTPPSLLQPSTEPDFLAMRQPFINRSIFHLWHPESALQVWNYNFNFFRRFGFAPDRAATLSNFTAPFFIDSQLKADNPTWWEISDQEMNTTTFNASLPVLEFGPDFSPVAPGWFRTIFGGGVQRKCADCEKEESIQRKENGNTEAPSIVNDAIHSGGQPLDGSTRSFMENRFGYDFSQVKIHNNTLAAKSAQSINALAYTSGNSIVFNQGQYSPGTTTGKKLLAHELTHVVQQQSGVQSKKVQRVYRLNELFQNGSAVQTNPVTSGPDVFFYPGSSANITQRRALVIAGIHGSEPSARALGHEVNNQLSAGTAQPDFHTLVVPQVNPSPTGHRSAGSGSTHVPDLNREFGTGYTSPNPLAQRITQIVNEFDPERVMSIHAISNPSLGGVFLDPIHSGTYPATGTASQRGGAFTGDPRNRAAMEMTENMINAIGNTSSTPGNLPTTSRPASQYPGAGGSSSPYSLIYPIQSGISTTSPTSLGVWVSGLGKPIVTIEIPGYNAPQSVWSTFVPAVWEFLRIPAATSNQPPSIVQEIIDWIHQLIQDIGRLLDTLENIPEPMPTENPPGQLPSSCLTFSTRADLDSRKAHWAGVIAGMNVSDVVNWVIGMQLPSGTGGATAESLRQKNCMLTALSVSAQSSGSPLQLPGSSVFNWSSGRRDFTAQNRIWHRKFIFDQTLSPFDRISDHARMICGSLLQPTETKWNPGDPRHRRCWRVAGLRNSTIPSMPAGARALTDDERQAEILQASSAPGISRHHWGTEFDLFSVEPAEWQTAGSGRNFADEYSWLSGNASTYGFIQSFTPLSAFRRLGYMEERWHWSYWPVAQALLEFVQTHQTDVETALLTQWGTQAEFSFIRAHWREFMFNVNQTP